MSIINGDVCNTHLGLSLGSQMVDEKESEIQSRKACLKSDQVTSFEPCLTLGLQRDETETRELHRQGSSQSDVSSFCNTVVKREREFGSEEMMCRRVVSDEDEDGNARKKLRLTKAQAALLEESFKENTTLNPRQKLALAKQLNLTPRQVEVWFQNRRARTKLKQTEVDCEYLKKWCEALTHENKRLQKELHELKAMKATPQLYMHLPAATLTVCPSCERIGGGGIINSSNNNTSTKGSYTVGKEPHLKNSFTQSSTAC